MKLKYWCCVVWDMAATGSLRGLLLLGSGYCPHHHSATKHVHFGHGPADVVWHLGPSHNQVISADLVVRSYEVFAPPDLMVATVQ